MTEPYNFHNYMGEFSTDAAALVFIRANDFDSNGDGTGNPQAGMLYFNTTDQALMLYTSAGWVSVGTGIPNAYNVAVFEARVPYSGSAGASAADKWTTRCMNSEKIAPSAGELQLVECLITSSDAGSGGPGSFVVAGDKRDYFPEGHRFDVRGTAADDTLDTQYVVDSASYSAPYTTITVAVSGVGGYIKTAVSTVTKGVGSIFPGMFEALEDVDVIVRGQVSGHRSGYTGVRLVKVDDCTYEKTAGYVTAYTGSNKSGVGGFCGTSTSVTIKTEVYEKMSLSAGDLVEVQQYISYVYSGSGEYRSWGPDFVDSEVGTTIAHAQMEIISLEETLGNQKLKRVDTGAWEEAQTGVEYYAPNQWGGAWGTIYCQYVNETSLTTGSYTTLLTISGVTTLIVMETALALEAGSKWYGGTLFNNDQTTLIRADGSNIQYYVYSSIDKMRGFVMYTKTA